MWSLLGLCALTLALRHSLKCSKIARGYKPVKRVKTMHVDTRTGELVFGTMSLETARRIMYFDLLLFRR